jgi:DNA polymerase I-like protein with 3'-5' exonuclease and polymerase domains
VVLDHKALRQAINFPIQANASDYCLLSMIELAPLLRRYNSHVILMVHDALVVESDRRYRSEVTALIQEVMQKPRFDGYPSIRVDVKVGDNLGNTK